MSASDGKTAAGSGQEELEGTDQDDLEDYLLLVLSDSALPTGGFVASSGLESFYQHGFVSSSSSANAPNCTFTLVAFLEESLSAYAYLNLPFFDEAHQAVWSLRTTNRESSSEEASIGDVVQRIKHIDAGLEAMLLNHVARRASVAQGIALLALYARAFADTTANCQGSGIQARLDALMESLKMASRGRNATLHGHLPICFAILCAVLGLSLARSRHLHLFLQARAILSSAVRLNLAGPYAAQRLLLVDVRHAVNNVLAEQEIRSKLPSKGVTVPSANEEEGPATTWPLGEILAARHDQLHSRIFNS